MQVSWQEVRLEEESSDEGEEGRREESLKSCTTGREPSDCPFIVSCFVGTGRSWRMQLCDKCPAGTGHKIRQHPSLMLYPIWLKKKSGGSPDLSSLPSLVPSLPSWSQNSTLVSTGSLE